MLKIITYSKKKKEKMSFRDVFTRNLYASMLLRYFRNRNFFVQKRFPLSACGNDIALFAERFLPFNTERVRLSEMSSLLYWNRNGLMYNHFVLTVIPPHIFANQLHSGISMLNKKQ